MTAMVDKVLVTGATGFVGRRLCQRIMEDGGLVRRALRCAGELDGIVVGDLSPETDWTLALAGMECVVHLAARVHVMHDMAPDVLAEFRHVNVDGTLNLARQASEMGVRRFVFISSIKVNGEQTSPGEPFAASDIPSPQDPYAVSKWEAEQGLFNLANETGMEVVIVRPPLVYGPGVKANFLSMMRWLSKGFPLPFGAIHNRRTLIALDNLVDLLISCIHHPAAANQVFLAGDDEDLSTTDLLRRLGDALGKPVRLFQVPAVVLETLAKMVGKQSIAQRLCGSLQIDITKTKQVLGWTPPMSVDDGLRKAAAGFMKSALRDRIQGD
jgi:nucleoside-diphosphate-sugar epimerase